MAVPDIVVKRIHEPAEDGDGRRILVDRIWPRGISRERALLDRWLPEVAPSTALRKWFDHDPQKWDEFCRRYGEELVDNPHVEELRNLSTEGRVTLLFSARDTQHNQAVALAAHLLD